MSNVPQNPFSQGYEIVIPLILTIPIYLDHGVIGSETICHRQENQMLRSLNSQNFDEYSQSSSQPRVGLDDINDVPMAEVFSKPFNHFKTISLAHAFSLFLTAGHGNINCNWSLDNADLWPIPSPS